MKREKPINADLPEPPPEPAEETNAAPEPEPSGGVVAETSVKPPASTQPAPPAAVEVPRDMGDEAQQRSGATGSPPPRRRQPKPLTPKLLAALVVIAVVFIVAAILGGTGGSNEGSGGGAPTPAGAPPGGGEEAGEGTAEAPAQLGFPGFATNNTTRIGGADAASIAAAAAFAAFPSTTPAQRPAAVTLVGEEDWAGAVAGAVLMAEPVRAPLLVTEAGGIPDATAEALAALDPAGDRDTGGAAAFAIGAADVPAGLDATSVTAGPAPVEAAAIAKLRDRLVGSPPAHVVVAPAALPELAIPAAAWAARSGDPVLFAEATELPPATASALRRYPGAPVYVLGPASAISDGVLAKIRRIAGTVRRVGAEEPVANALAFARYRAGSFGWNVNDPGHGFVLARAEAPLDAAAAAALSGSGTWGPLLLTDSATKLPAELRSYFLDVKPGYTNPTRSYYNHVWVIGDQEAIDVNQQAEASELAETAKLGGEE